MASFCFEVRDIAFCHYRRRRQQYVAIRFGWQSGHLRRITRRRTVDTSRLQSRQVNKGIDVKGGGFVSVSRLYRRFR